MSDSSWTQCDSCGASILEHKAKKAWSRVHLARFHGKDTGGFTSFDLCPKCLPAPMTNNGLIAALKRALGRGRRGGG